ncbi:30S ribosome-binding factor RbfA [Candidatus Erwinia haradaeae]|uniref:Ribosome-binding factor A n=1 Tax=Candidatus Erwinia haradaeae TaxID=1922217 RepID=A0A451DAE4_9GAMM|nr:30S ribosome-binding factor RbfA [Candidatus Erwinia haradaeae]VFP83277.1 30S ribosome-binding factor [Candidatus Erwinia haradaeae]
MAKACNRLQRISQVMKKEIAIIVQSEMHDPRLDKIVTVSSIMLSRDLSYAKVFVTFLNDQDEMARIESLRILSSAAGYIRTLLSQTMRLRITPKLRFYHDNSFLEGMRISRLVTNIIKSDQ